jgi:hypothetical protein
MQRKNYILKSTTKRDGMAMIMAIFVIVIISTILTLSLSLTTKTTENTTNTYLYEQAIILSNSATEYAVLKSSLVNQCNLGNNGKINFRYNNTFDINISVGYIAADGTPCNNNATAQGTKISDIHEHESDGTMIVDVTVTANPTGTTEPIRYFKRTIQKL